MLTTILVLAMNSQGYVARATSHGASYDATRPTVRYGASGQSKLARNWYDHRPVGKLFAADEGGNDRAPYTVDKGGI